MIFEYIRQVVSLHSFSLKWKLVCAGPIGQHKIPVIFSLLYHFLGFDNSHVLVFDTYLAKFFHVLGDLFCCLMDGSGSVSICI